MSKEIKAVPGVIRTRVPGTEAEPMMSVTFYLPVEHVPDFIGLDGREVTLTVPEAPAPAVPPCTERHGHPDPAYMCLAPAGHK